MKSPPRQGNRVQIYTDGGCDPNPGPGGWGAILLSGSHIKEISGNDPATTNNRMELTAAIEALSLLTRPCEIDLYTDSQYLRRGMTEWVSSWKRRGWQRANGAAVENVDLWKALLAAAEPHDISWHWVKGHRGNRWNERADQLASEARHELFHRKRLKEPRVDKELAREQGRELPAYDIICRGSALGSPGPAGYAAIIVGAAGKTVRSGAWPHATNNVMELWAAVAGLQALSDVSQATIYTPSKYVIDGATKWLARWERSGWRTSSGEPVKHREIWQELDEVMGDHDVRWQHLSLQESNSLAAEAAAIARREAEEVAESSA